jgi:hypothetical protein
MKEKSMLTYINYEHIFKMGAWEEIVELCPTCLEQFKKDVEGMPYTFQSMFLDDTAKDWRAMQDGMLMCVVCHDMPASHVAFYKLVEKSFGKVSDEFIEKVNKRSLMSLNFDNLFTLQHGGLDICQNVTAIIERTRKSASLSRVSSFIRSLNSASLPSSDNQYQG